MLEEIPRANTPWPTGMAGRQSVSTLVVYPKKNPPKKAKTADRYVAFITNVGVDDPGDLLRPHAKKRTASGGA